MIAEEGRGCLLYLRQEGRGIGLVNKVRAYHLQDRGLDTVQANLALGLPADGRDYTSAAAVLRALGLEHVRRITNNPSKIAGLESHGIGVESRYAHLLSMRGGRGVRVDAYYDRETALAALRAARRERAGKADEQH